ncbi:nucleotidyl transferase AbiEii/AbiGii toxin family protein [Brevibacterium sp. CBA3109]|uniref:nucleotidyl transferase AbiEii/AbiGii toxin family protein n=1 Tax=Brevibacterium koreense TaxID=3140787 RepID=UPI00330678C2
MELIDLEYQIAQKIHVLTDPDSSRAHDLVDLQLLWAADPELDSVREFCVRTFDFRRAQKWPPLQMRPMDGWEPAYQLSREETEIDGDSLVLADIDSARAWFKQIVTSINSAATT